jgi:hypothetical protein
MACGATRTSSTTPSTQNTTAEPLSARPMQERDVRTSIAAVIATLGLGGCAAGSSTTGIGTGSGTNPSGIKGSSITVSKAKWHDGPWPFTVPRGILGCTQPPFPGAVTFNVDGTLYAINGTAEDAHMGRNVNPIWKKAPYGLRVDIGGMIDKGLALCPS